MGYETRSPTNGNQRADYTKIRQSLQAVSPAVRATLRNAVPKNGSSPSNNEIKGKDTINPYKLERLSNIISNNINAVSDLRAITPYIDKAELIWNTILLYPNGKQDKVLTYDTQTTKFKNTVLHQQLLKIWDDYFTNNYKIEQELGGWANDILWNTGSVVLFNLSRPGLDYLINGSEIDPTKAREGSEALAEFRAYEAKAKAEVLNEFVNVNGRYLAKNKGRFVRDPSEQKDNVGGLEALFKQRKSYHGQEFNIFKGIKGKDFYTDPEAKEFKEYDLSSLANVTMTDNLSILYLQKFEEENRNRDINDIMGVESVDNFVTSAFTAKKKREKKPEKPEATTQNLNEDQLETLAHEIFPGRNIRHQTMQHVKALDTLSVQPYGRGLVWHVPSEAVVPIHYNGRHRHKIDYIFLLDDEGNFLKSAGDDSFYQNSGHNSINNQSVQNRPTQGSTDQLISSLRMVQEGKPCDFDMAEFADLAKSTLVKQWIQSAISGAGDQISITLDEETNKIFLARMFRRQGVRCLYVPGEAVTYMAFKYNRLGMGQSLTQMAKMHIARLAAFDFADALANLEAAQPHSMMTITPEKLDSDPHQTAAIARAKFFATNPRLHSLLSSAQLSVPQIADALRESSLTIKVNAGENPNMPAPDISLQRMDKEHFKPVDDASRQKVLNDISNYFHLPRAWLDVSDEQNNFQIEAITEHQMVHNQGANWQDMFCEGIIDFERKHARVNAPLMQDLVQEIVENKKLWLPDSKEKIEADNDEQMVKIILSDFFTSIYCSLPEANSTENTNKLKDQLQAVNDLVQAWEDMSGNTKVMDQMIKAMGITAEKYSPDEIKASIKSVFMSEAFRRFNLPMPFDDIVNDGKGGGIASLVNAITNQRRNVTEFVMKFLEEEQKNDKKMASQYKRLVEKLNLPEDGGEGGELDADGNPIVPDAGTGVPGDGDEIPGGTGDAELDAALADAGVPPADDGDTPPGEEDETPAEDETGNEPPAPGDADAPPVPDDSEPSEEEEEGNPEDKKPGGKDYNPF